MYLWSLQRADGFGFLPCVIFAACMALRLARFNAALDSAPSPPYADNFFTGVPAPAGAGLALLPLFLSLEGKSEHWLWLSTASRHSLFCAFVLVGTAFLLVSTLPVWSFKKIKVPAHHVLPLILGTTAFAILLVADTWAALAAAGLIYLVMVPFSVRSFRRLGDEGFR
jgi:CDP-diacylglycerol--serine O-phosphatidyltransferase